MTRDHFSKEMERDVRRWEQHPPLSIPVLLEEITWYNKIKKLMKRGKKKWVEITES